MRASDPTCRATMTVAPRPAAIVGHAHSGRTERPRLSGDHPVARCRGARRRRHPGYTSGAGRAARACPPDRRRGFGAPHREAVGNRPASAVRQPVDAGSALGYAASVAPTQPEWNESSHRSAGHLPGDPGGHGSRGGVGDRRAAAHRTVAGSSHRGQPRHPRTVWRIGESSARARCRSNVTENAFTHGDVFTPTASFGCVRPGGEEGLYTLSA